MRGLPGASGPGRLTPLPTAVLAIGLLAAGRRADRGHAHARQVIDVGTASALGAPRILHGQSIYYYRSANRDTYGPLAYLAYVPFECALSGSLEQPPRRRAAAITFDLLTVAACSCSDRGCVPAPRERASGCSSAWLWAACPFRVLGHGESTNDGLVALIGVLVMLALNEPDQAGRCWDWARRPSSSPPSCCRWSRSGAGE